MYHLLAGDADVLPGAFSFKAFAHQTRFSNLYPVNASFHISDRISLSDAAAFIFLI